METMTAEQAAEWGKTLDFQIVWAALMENREQQKENAAEMKAMSQETEKKFQEVAAQTAKTDAQIKAMWQETAAQMEKTEAQMERTAVQLDELSKNVGGVNNSLGDMAEGLMASDLYKTFEDLGLEFDHSFANYEVKDKKTKQKLAEVDMLLVNGTIALAVEAKAAMTRGDVDKHEKRMDILRHEPNSLFANRKLYGAMASVKTSKMARKYAIAKGFFVIELTGDTIKVDMPEGFEPKPW